MQIKKTTIMAVFFYTKKLNQHYGETILKQIDLKRPVF